MAFQKGHKFGKRFEKGHIPSNKGKPMLEEQKEKIRKAKKGTSVWNKGMKGELYKGYFPNGMGGLFKRGETSWNKGNKGFLAGDKHYNWKGGISKIAKLLGQTYEYQQWRSDIFERDNWTCQTCRTRGGNLEVHHIYRFYWILKENNIKTIEEARNCKELWDIDNGVTLCLGCHKLTFKGKPKYGK